MISNVEVPHPVEYLPTGDHGLLQAWVSTPPIFFLGGQLTSDVAHKAAEYLRSETQPRALLCLEDGRAVLATLAEFKFDYRYDINKGRFVDVSSAQEGEDADTDQEPTDDGSQGVQGQVPDPD